MSDWVRAQQTSWAPSPASSQATASPMPLPAPVTTPARPFRSNSIIVPPFLAPRSGSREDHGLELGELLDADIADLATDAALLVATPGQPQRRAGPGVVDEDGAGAHGTHVALRLGRIARPDAGREAEDGVVGDADRLFFCVEGDHHEHRPEDLLLSYAHPVIDVDEDRGRKEEA